MLKEIRTELLKKIERFARIIPEKVVTTTTPMTLTCRWSKDPVPFNDRMKLDEKPSKEGDVWGHTWESAWFHVQGEVPKEWAGKKVTARLDFNGEGLVFDKNGVIIQGITNGSIFTGHHHPRDMVLISNKAKGGEKVELWAEAAANALFGVTRHQHLPKDDPKLHGEYEGKVVSAKLCIFDEETWQLKHDVDVLLSLFRSLPEESPRAAKILHGLDRAVNLFVEDPANSGKCRATLKELLSKPAHASDLTVTSIGHAHIDTAWLWPVRETIRKCARTFSNQLQNIEKYPDYIFSASQPQQYAFMKEHYPELYQRIKQAVKKNRWEPVGGMWVEADCNIISGESMTRQFLYGKNFFMDEFGQEMKIHWLPDVFGYSGALPQIMKKSGIDYFITMKLAWNRFTKNPNHTFNWKGIDGTEVLAHFLPCENYNSFLTPEIMNQAQNRFHEKHILDGFVSMFGVGDGGGGPREDFIERGIRMQNLEGCPKVKFGKVSEFFDALSSKKDLLSTWVGELYLEFHRGTLTTQAKTKRGNRKLEQSLRQTEALCTLLPADQYPRKEIDSAWKDLLLDQFHDIIPGSSIHVVYEIAEKDYERHLGICDQLRNKAVSNLFKKDDEGIVLFNALSSPYKGVIELPEGWTSGLIDKDGHSIPTQKEGNRTVAFVEIPACGFTSLKKSGQPTEAATAAHPSTDAKLVLENSLIRYTLKKTGKIVSAFDKSSGREFIRAGESANELCLYQDTSVYADAWDFDHYYTDQLIETQRVDGQAESTTGPVWKSLTLKLKIGVSSITQRITLAEGSKKLEFKTDVDWNENQRMLRVNFPVDLEAATARFEIQYGFLERPNHENTLSDMARFEVAAQRYIDLSRSDCGAAILNDCKYGHRILGRVLSMSLLRSTTDPDPIADRGTQQFTYAFLPHEGGLAGSEVLVEAEQLNLPPAIFTGYAAGPSQLPCVVEGDGLTLEALKRAEKEDCLIIRVVENNGRQTKGRLKFNIPAVTLVETNLIEWTNGEKKTVRGNEEITMKPFEIRTWKVKPA